MYALVDCNNFYCSCERLFNPKLEGRPVIVLSNNDGCAIARSDEAKALGIEMAMPAFMIEDVIKKNNVAVFSSNYTLYGDMSERVMKTLSAFVPRIELYSIDEAFLDMHDLAYQDLLKLGMQIRKTVMKNIGIPVTVGIAATKTLAKLANRFAKKKRKDIGVHWLANDYLVKEALEATEVQDIWGIGKQYALFLKRHGFKTAADFVNAPEEWVRKNMSVVRQRLLNELKGIPAIEWEFEPKAKKNICSSRSFGQLLIKKEEIIQALTNFCAICSAKLRSEKSCAQKLHVFIHTNPYRTEDKQYVRSITIQMDVATNDTTEIIKYALKGLNIIFQDGYNYHKVGIIALDLVPEKQIQSSMFDNTDRLKGKTVMTAIDKLNKTFGRNVVRFAVQGYENRHKLRAEYLSKRYTTNINEVVTVKS